MRFLACFVFTWALVTEALVNGDFQTVIVEMHDTEQQCNDSKEKQRINGECLQAEAIIPVNPV